MRSGGRGGRDGVGIRGIGGLLRERYFFGGSYDGGFGFRRLVGRRKRVRRFFLNLFIDSPSVKYKTRLGRGRGKGRVFPFSLFSDYII